MKKTFLKWWLQSAVVFCACLFAAYLGLFKEAYMNDSSYLCIVIFNLFIAFTLYNGYVAYNLDSGLKVKPDDMEPTWFISELCLALGMIGTVIGFISMLKGFDNVGDASKSIQKLMSGMSYGMATALYTTLVGLVFGNILKMQAFQIERAIEAKLCQSKKNMDQTQAS
jgi:hypothetical protein